MRESSSLKDLHFQVVFLKMQEKTTAELISIWEKDYQVLEKDEIDAIQKILLERQGKLPEQKISTMPQPDRMVALSKVHPSDEPLGQPFFNLSPMGNLKLAFLIIIFGCLFFGAILGGMVEQNSKIYWDFIKNVSQADIKKIEVQQIARIGESQNTTITVTDKNIISKFVLAIKTVQEEYGSSHPNMKINILVKLWLADNKTIEFQCYTLNGAGNTLFVGDIELKPSFYSFGVGHAKFPAPDFYNWLLGIGVIVQ